MHSLLSSAFFNIKSLKSHKICGIKCCKGNSRKPPFLSAQFQYWKVHIKNRMFHRSHLDKGPMNTTDLTVKRITFRTDETYKRTLTRITGELLENYWHVRFLRVVLKLKSQRVLLKSHYIWRYWSYQTYHSLPLN